MEALKEYFNIFKSSILAGIAISLGCIVNLRVGGIFGAVLFSFGLLTCVHYRLSLYTGTAGFIATFDGLYKLIVILLGNIVGCLILALGMRYSSSGVIGGALAIVEKRASYDWLQMLILSGCCGFIMTTAVQFARGKQFLPLLFGVPLFILCGFVHSIADACYYLLSMPLYDIVTNANLMSLYGIAVLGNFIGCNLYRLIMMRMDYGS